MYIVSFMLCALRVLLVLLCLLFLCFSFFCPLSFRCLRQLSTFNVRRSSGFEPHPLDALKIICKQNKLSSYALHSMHNAVISDPRHRRQLAMELCARAFEFRTSCFLRIFLNAFVSVLFVGVAWFAAAEEHSGFRHYLCREYLFHALGAPAACITRSCWVRNTKTW